MVGRFGDWAMTRAGFFLGTFVLCLIAVNAQAQSLSAGLANCLRIPGVLERLACYDKLAKGVAVSTAPSAAYVPPSVASAAPIRAPEQFGAETLPRSAPAATTRTDHVSSQITDFKLSPSGRFIVVLANGQTWRQMEGDHTNARFHPGQTSSVTISRGAFGSYDLAFNDRSVVYKVIREN
jgi:hypothetical protein